jgi:hypothetical protein
MLSRGNARLRINGQNQGAIFSQRGNGYTSIDLGTRTLTAAPQTFRFEVTGTSGTGYGLSFDYISLTP